MAQFRSTLEKPTTRVRLRRTNSEPGTNSLCNVLVEQQRDAIYRHVGKAEKAEKSTDLV